MVLLTRSEFASLSEKILSNELNVRWHWPIPAVSVLSVSFCPLTVLRLIVRQKLVTNFSARQRWRAQRREL